MTDILARIEEFGVASQTHEHPPVATVEEARTHWAAIDAAHTKNLFLKDAGSRYWLIVMPADMPLDLRQLPARIGSKRLRFASADDLQRLLGIGPGSVSALALVNDSERAVTLVIDRSLIDKPTIAQHPLVNTRTTVMAPAALIGFLASLGVTPLVVELAAE